MHRQHAGTSRGADASGLVVYLDNATIVNACSLLGRPETFDIYKLLDLEAFCQAFLLFDEVRTLVGHSFRAGMRDFNQIYTRLLDTELLRPEVVQAGGYYVEGIEQLDQIALSAGAQEAIVLAARIFGNETPWENVVLGEETFISHSYPIYHFSRPTVERQSESDSAGELRNKRLAGWEWGFALSGAGGEFADGARTSGVKRE
jgi:hypothetical protein